MAKRAFISHISEEAEVATQLKSALNHDFLGLFHVFVSSDGESILAGDEWLKSIDAAIRQASLMLILCSPASICRPWINFEAGAAWMQNIPIIPICHAGLTLRDLPAPLSFRQGLLLTDARSLNRLYARVARELKCAVPDRSFEDLATSLDKAGLHDRDHTVKRRLDEALRHEKFKWRSLESVATAAGVSVEVAADHLRADAKVRFDKGKMGRVIVGLRSRVG